MKTIIAGSRAANEYSLLLEAIEQIPWEITEVVSGGASGADKLGELWAKENAVPIKVFTPDWKKYGRGAGPQRNREMADYAEALIALWDQKSKGTKHMIETAGRKGLKVLIWHCNDGGSL